MNNANKTRQRTRRIRRTPHQRKRQRELEQRMEAVKRGELPEFTGKP